MLKKVKIGTLKRTQFNLIFESTINPITVIVESQNQGVFHTKILMQNHVIGSD